MLFLLLSFIENPPCCGEIRRFAMYLYLTKIQRCAYVSRSPLQGAFSVVGL